MSVVRLASSHTALNTPPKRALEIHGAADISFIHKDNETALERLYYRDPLKVLFPRADVMTAALLTTGGGLFGGDLYDIDLRLGPKAQCMVTGQAAEKVYKSSGPDCEITINLNVEELATLEWLPQETILFDQARFRRTTNLHLSKKAQALVGEIIVFGRLASGEEVKSGLLREAWDVRIEGKRAWADALHIEDEFKDCLDHLSGFGGARAMATALYYGDDQDALLEKVRAHFSSGPQTVRVGVSRVNDLLLCRWLAEDPYELRKSFGAFWAFFRHHALGRSNQLPRLWQC